MTRIKLEKSKIALIVEFQVIFLCLNSMFNFPSVPTVGHSFFLAICPRPKES
jgi:hypothetical protein